MRKNKALAMEIRGTTLSRTFMMLGTAALLGGCAMSQGHHTHNGDAIYDPYENTNRAFFDFNKSFDETVLHPTLKGYRTVVPKPARKGLENFLRHLKSPVRFANQILQGDVDGAGTELTRTIINTFVGFGGLFDVAEYEGIKYESEDFGQTLAVWGVDHGPYLVVPFLGPSSTRDYVGYAVDSIGDPMRFYLRNIDEEGWYYAKVGADYLVLRDGLMDVLEELEASSIDYYAAVRSTYYQRREAMVNDSSEKMEADDFYYPEFEE